MEDYLESRGKGPDADASRLHILLQKWRENGATCPEPFTDIECEKEDFIIDLLKVKKESYQEYFNENFDNITNNDQLYYFYYDMLDYKNFSLDKLQGTERDYAARIIAGRYVVQITITIDIKKFTVDVPLTIIVLIQNHFTPVWGNKQTGQTTGVRNYIHQAVARKVTCHSRH